MKEKIIIIHIQTKEQFDIFALPFIYSCNIISESEPKENLKESPNQVLHCQTYFWQHLRTNIATTNVEQKY